LNANKPNAADQFIGSWSLVSWSVTAPDGAVTYPYGEDAIGRIMYQPEGKMVACLMHRQRTPFASGNRHEATSAECIAAYREYVSYFGSFTVQESADTVTHHVEGATFSNWIGTDLVRNFVFDGNTLTLSLVAPNGSTHQLIWANAKSAIRS